MIRIEVCLVLLLCLLSPRDASAQVSLHLQDLTVTPIASNVSHAGDLAVDGTGNVWIVATQGAIGGTGGTLTQVMPSGTVVPNAVTGLSQVGDLMRASDGNVYFWMNIGATTTALTQLTLAGAVTQMATLPGFVGAGIAQDSSGNFYLGTNPAGGSGIYQLAPGSSTPTFFAIGIDHGALAVEQTHLAIDAQDQLFVATLSEVAEVTTAVSTTTLYYAIPCLAPFCPPVIKDLEIGYHDSLLAFSYFTLINATTQLLGIRGPQVTYPVVSFGPEFNLTVPAAMGRGIASDHYTVDRSGNLYHITGTTATLTLSIPATGLLQVDVHAPAASPMILAADVPGLELVVPGVGTFHTSIGTGPGFTVITDGTGIFQAPDPTAVTPWSATYFLPPAPLGINFTLEAYVLNGAAGNPLGVMISNAIQFGL